MSKSPASGPELRLHPRVPVKQRVWCEGDHLTLYVQAINVSNGGFFVRAPSPAELGEHLKVTFVADDGPVIAQTEVVWRRAARGDDPAGMGLRILAFEDGESRFLEFVARRLAGASASDSS